MIDRSQLQNLCDEYVLGLLEGEELQQLEQLFQSNDAEALEGSTTPKKPRWSWRLRLPVLRRRRSFAPGWKRASRRKLSRANETRSRLFLQRHPGLFQLPPEDFLFGPAGRWPQVWGSG